VAPGGIPVYLEIGIKKVFACSLEWPGWCRAGKTEEDALQVLAAYAPRYREVAEMASRRFPTVVEDALQVVERIPGSGTTDFGAPGEVAAADRGKVDARTAGRLRDLLQAVWEYLDRVVAGAPAVLKKGPRGGGRDRDQVFGHVLGAEAGYSRSLGLKLKEPPADDPQAIKEFRNAILEVIRPSNGTEQAKWPVPYAVRRIAWHALDHAWEIQDKSS